MNHKTCTTCVLAHVSLLLSCTVSKQVPPQEEQSESLRKWVFFPLPCQV